MSIFIGLLECDCRILGSTSLKDKRRVLQSVQTKISHQFNLAVAEVGRQDHWQFTQLAFVGVGSHQQTVERELRKASNLLENRWDLEILDAQIIWR